MPMNEFEIHVLNQSVATYYSGLDSKPAVLVIHGNSIHSGFFRELIEILDQQFFVITLDLPGHNKSGTWNPEEYTRKNFALLFNTLLDSFDLKEVNAFGFSMGGFILLECFDKIPLIRKLAVSGHPPLTCFSDMQDAYYLNEDSALFLQGELSDNEVERIYNAVIKIQDTHIKEKIKKSIKETSPFFREGCLNLAQNTHNEVEILNRSKIPVAVFHASGDQVVKLEYLEKTELLNLWEHKVHVIPDSGHFVMIENPESLAFSLSRFFNE